MPTRSASRQASAPDPAAYPVRSRPLLDRSLAERPTLDGDREQLEPRVGLPASLAVATGVRSISIETSEQASNPFEGGRDRVQPPLPGPALDWLGPAPSCGALGAGHWLRKPPPTDEGPSGQERDERSPHE